MQLNLNIDENENFKDLVFFLVKINQILKESNSSDET